MAEERFPPHVLAETAVAGPATVAAYQLAHPPPVDPRVPVCAFLDALVATEKDIDVDFSWVWDYLSSALEGIVWAFDDAAELPPITRIAWLRTAIVRYGHIFLDDDPGCECEWDFPKYFEIALANGLETELAAGIEAPVSWWGLTEGAISWVVDQLKTAHVTGDHPRMAALRAIFNWADLEELEECVEEGQAELSPADLAAVRQILQPPKGAGCA